VLQARIAFQDRQLQAIQLAEPGWVLASPPARLLGITYEAFFAPPAYWDISNYAETTKPFEQSYQGSMWSGFPPAPWWQAIWFALVCMGVAMGIKNVMRMAGIRPWIILWIWSLSFAVGILFGVPILWQRYYVILVLPLCIWASVGLSVLVRAVLARWKTIAEK
jgi:hypothetical protein